MNLSLEIIEKLQSPFDLKGNEATVGASIGISIFPLDGENSETITKNADTAMYEAKKKGRGTFHFCSWHN